MYAFETVVIVAIVTLLSPSLSSAKDAAPISFGSAGCSAETTLYVQNLGKDPNFNSQAQQTAAQQSLLTCQKNNIKDGDDCQEAPGDFKKAMEDFKNDCKEA